LAYTATFGSGFSATISVEDRTSGTGNRENGAFTRNFLGFGGAGASVLYEGQDFPDIVASLRVDQGWGSAQLSGALTQRKVSGLTLAGAAIAPIAFSSDEYGWAIQGGVKINLPMLAAGDHLFLQAAYADGALGYLGWSGNYGVGRTGPLILGDIGYDPATGSTKTSTGWSVVAGLRHFWTPQLRSELYGSYSEIKLGYNNPVANYAIGAVGRSLDPKEFIVAGNLIWSPVSGLDIGVEVLYTRVELRDRVGTAVNGVGIVRNGALGIKNDDAWAGRLRIQRDF
jgi:hypothetical protein